MLFAVLECKLPSWLLPHQPVQSDCLAQNEPTRDYICIMSRCRSVLAQPRLLTPPPRLLSSYSAVRHADSPHGRTWHLPSPRPRTIINTILSRSTVRYLILSHGEKKGGGEKNPLLRMLMLCLQPLLGGTRQCRAAQSLREVSGRGRRVEAFPGRY